MALKPQPGIMNIAPYVGGDSAIAGVTDVLKLSSNENPNGPSEKARLAYAQASLELERYPSSDHAGLRDAIGEVYGLDPAKIVCGAGSDELISFLCHSYAGPGDEIIHTEHGFAMYRISALAAGATPVEVPEKARVTDVDAILASVTDRTRIVFVANPNNPTGTMVDDGEISRLAECLPAYVLLVIDGAYAEFVERYDSGAKLVAAHSNVVMIRTFSKIFGLSSLRIGWAYAPETVTDVLNRVRGPFNVTTPALAAAQAAVLDQSYVAECATKNADDRTFLTQGLEALGIAVDASFGNFVLARFADAETASATDAHLRGCRIIVRNVASYNLPQALRITVPDRAGCVRVLDAVAEFMQGRGQ